MHRHELSGAWMVTSYSIKVGDLSAKRTDWCGRLRTWIKTPLEPPEVDARDPLQFDFQRRYFVSFSQLRKLDPLQIA